MAEAKTALYGDDEAPGVVGLLTIAEARLRECESWSGQLRDFSARARELLALSQELERLGTLLAQQNELPEQKLLEKSAEEKI